MVANVTSVVASSEAPTARHQMEEDLRALEQDVRDLAVLARTALAGAVQALIAQDADRQQEIVDGDREIDRRYLDVERRGFAVVARHAPVASDLRLVTALVHTGLHLERIGDAAVNVATIGEITRGLPAESEVLSLLQTMADQVVTMVDAAMEAFAQRDSGQARSLVAMDDRLDQLDRDLFTRSLTLNATAGVRQWAIRMHEVSRQLERAGDHAVDIGEQVWFLVTGEFAEFEDSQGPT